MSGKGRLCVLHIGHRKLGRKEGATNMGLFREPWAGRKDEGDWGSLGYLSFT